MDNERPQQLASLPWDDLRLFLAVIESGSINRAAQSLGLGQATVSRRLAALEAQVGHALFVRSVAGVTLTGLGEQMAEPLKRMADLANEVTRAAVHGDARVSGVVRVTAAPLVSATILAQFASQLRDIHPNIQVEVLSTVRYLDLARGEADLAIRSVQPGDGDLTSVVRIEHTNHVYVARKWARRFAVEPELGKLPWVAWSSEFDHRTPNPQLRQMFPGFKPTFTADNFLVLVQAAEAGLGAIVLGDPIARLLHKSNLVALEASLGPYDKSEVHLVAASSALRLPKVRAVADELAKYLRQMAHGLSKPRVLISPHQQERRKIAKNLQAE